MMKFYSRTLPLLVLASGVSSANAQMFKCRDQGGHITYTNQACDKQGLTQVGEVGERVTVLPSPAAGKPAPTLGAAPGGEGPLPTTKLKPVSPLLDKRVK